MMDMPKHIRIGKTPLIFSYFATLFGRRKFLHLDFQTA